MSSVYLPNTKSTPLDDSGCVADLSALKQEILGLHEVYRQRLIRYAVSLGLTSSDAEDVVQETFLALFRHLRAERPRTNLSGWIFRVAHRMSLKRRISYRSEAGSSDGSPVDDRARTPNPEEQVLFDEQQQRLQRIFKVLPEIDRLCLQLRAEGLKYRDIAGVLNISVGTVYNSLERSLMRFR
jgi:RNA polymerase sigma-70 factor (ECF subfamily)